MPLQSVIYMVPLFLLAITVHEYAHALVAVRLGDNMPLRNQSLTWNVKRHLAPVGLIALLLFGVGWSKPTQVARQPFNRRHALYIALAGPLANVLLAAAFAVFYHLLNRSHIVAAGPSVIATVLYAGVRLNVLLALFNLVPLPPLDGAVIAKQYASPRHMRTWFVLDQYGELFILLALVLLNLHVILGRLTTWLMPLFGFGS